MELERIDASIRENLREGRFTASGRTLGLEGCGLFDFVEGVFPGLSLELQEARYQAGPEELRLAGSSGIGEVAFVFSALENSRVELCLATGWDLALGGRFHLTELGAQAVAADRSFSLTLTGTMAVGSSTLPLVVRRVGGWCLLGVHTPPEGLVLASLDDVSRLAGLELTGILPPFFHLPERIVLQTLSATVSLSLDTLYSAEFAVAVQEWVLFDGLTVRELSFDVMLQDLSSRASAILGVRGTIAMGEFAVVLSGALQTRGNRFSVGGRLPQDERIDCNRIFDAVSSLLGLPELRLPRGFPSVWFQDVDVRFEVTEKSFHASARMVVEEGGNGLLDVLLRAEALFAVDVASGEGGRRAALGFHGRLELAGQLFTVDYASGGKIQLAWTCPVEASPLELGAVCRAFGLEVPEAVGRLGVSLTRVSAGYDLGSGELAFEAEAERYGSISFVLGQRGEEKTFSVDVKCLASLGLGSLPVVGTDLHLLDQVALRDLLLHAASGEGVTFSGAVDYGGGVQPFSLTAGAPAPREGAEAGPLAAGEDPGVTKWFSLEKHLGIFAFHRLGVTYRGGRAGFVLDAGLAANPVGLELVGLGLGVSLSDPRDVGFFLSGLGVSYQNPALEVSGALVLSQGEYDGIIRLRAKQLTLLALASYREQSLLAFALLRAPIGGPPAFFITGVAAGFGYNRALALPDIGEVERFPLVDGAFGRCGEAELLAGMKAHIQPASGRHFVAAGVTFTSFKMADSFALVTAAFGGGFTLALLGLSEITVPRGCPGVAPVAFAQLAIRAVVDPGSGLFSLQAQLTDESYLLSRDCKLTGGFAFFVWYGGEHKGDFVITLGGYHRNYQKPAHYPDVPRLGIYWRLTREIEISGEAYFALTPSALMAGGGLSLVYQSGALRAWLTARADFLLCWKPYYYEASLYLSVGASYRAFLLFGYVTFRLELSVSLDLWGPRFSGRATIHWFIISFTIRFGDPKGPKQYIQWDDFAQSFLPHAQGEQNGPAPLIPAAISVSDGLLQELGEGEEKTPVVRASALELSIALAVPCTTLKVNDLPESEGAAPLGVLPMGENRPLASACTVTLTPLAGNEAPKAAYAPVYGSLPRALWGLTEQGEELIPGALTGLTLGFAPAKEYPTLPADRFLDTRELTEYSKIQKDFAWTLPLPAAGPAYPREGTLEVLGSTVAAGKAAKKRGELAERFAALGFSLGTMDPMTRMGAGAEDLFYEDITLTALVEMDKKGER